VFLLLVLKQVWPKNIPPPDDEFYCPKCNIAVFRSAGLRGLHRHHLPAAAAPPLERVDDLGIG